MDRLRRVWIFVAVASLVVGTSATGPGSIGQLPIQIDLKERFAFSPTQMSAFFAITGVPWNVKPLAAVITDAFRIRGSRRRAYLLLAASGAALSWLVFALSPDASGMMLAAGLGVETSVMLASIVLGAVLVEAGQRRGATGRLTAVRFTAIFVGGIAAGLIGGRLATKPLWYTAACAVGLQAVLLVTSLACVDEPVGAPQPSFREAFARLLSALRSRPLLLSAALGFLVLAEPGFGTLLLYRQREELGHSPELIGMTRMATTLAAAVLGVAYAKLCQRFTLRRLLVVGTVAHASGALLFLAFGRAPWLAIAICAAYGAVSALAILPLWDLAARAAPTGFEGVAYALMMSALNLAQSASDLFGSHLHDRWGVSFEGVVWLNSTFTLAVLLALRLLPPALVDRTDQRAG